jgi:hypothetical protein
MTSGSERLYVPRVNTDGTIFLFRETSHFVDASMASWHVFLLLPKINYTGEFKLFEGVRFHFDSIVDSQERSRYAQVTVKSEPWSSNIQKQVLHKVTSTSVILDNDIWSPVAQDILATYTTDFFETKYLLMLQLVERNHYITDGWIYDDGKIQLRKIIRLAPRPVYNFFYEFDTKFDPKKFYVDFTE